MSLLLPFGLFLCFVDGTVSVDSNFTTKDLFNMKEFDLINNTVLEDNKNSSPLVDSWPKSYKHIHINSTHESIKVNKNNLTSTKSTSFPGQSGEVQGLLKNINGSLDLLIRSTESLLDLDHYREIENKTKKENSFRKQNKNKFVYRNFTEVFSSINHTITSIDLSRSSTKKFDNETFAAATEHPVNSTQPKINYFDRHLKIHNTVPLVEISTRKHMVDIISTVGSASKNITETTVNHKSQYPHAAENEYEMENDSVISDTKGTSTNLKTTGLRNTSQTYSQLDVHNYMTTKSYIFFSKYNLTGSNHTTESLTAHSTYVTRRLHKTSEIKPQTEFPVTSTNIIKPTQYGGESKDNVSKESVTYKAELGYNYTTDSEIYETSTDTKYRLTYTFPELDNKSNSWHPFGITDPELSSKFPSDDTNGQDETPEEHQTQPPELINTTDLNYTQCSNNLCIHKRVMPQSLYENSSVTYSISNSDEQSVPVKHENITSPTPNPSETVTNTVRYTEMNEQFYTETVSAAVSESITIKGKTDQRSQKAFLMVPWKTLTAENLQYHCVTVVFQTTVTNALWLSSYDIKFRRFISNILNKMKFQTTGNIMYVSPTPISINNELLVAFVVEAQIDGNETYMPGLDISWQLNEDQENLQAEMDIKINKIQIGFPEILKKDSYCKVYNKSAIASDNFSQIVLTAFLTSIVVLLVAVGIYTALHFHWTTYFSPEQQNIEDSVNLTDPEELSQTARYKAPDVTTKESYPLETITKDGVNDSDNKHHERKSTSHNSVCTLEEQ